ncbi:GNAT family N-acetyltransferase [Priestia koreensis]|uniref:Acetyltransferase n=1 Tax=Priestia koreensis TaxID=284581 RepID=A0A0M0L4X7_9BACI|nr:GNAT family N-acetyltransferase [Priestia koreensis]KOO46125.1 acetyltransferase [Priestia koreensis]
MTTKSKGLLLEHAEIDCLTSRLTVMEQLPGNPMNVEIKHFGRATAFSVQNIPGPSFNTVKGLQDGDESYVEDILAFYKEKGIPVRFELTPAHVSSNLLTYLAKKGFYQHDFHTSFYKPLIKEEAQMNASVSVRELREDEFSLFGELYTKGFSMPPFLASGVASNNQILFGKEGWSFYVAEINGKPAGIGVLFLKDGMATMAAAATIPEQRRKGVQTALLQKRLVEALNQECYLAVSQARFGSVSHANMERIGFQIGYTKTIWIQE